MKAFNCHIQSKILSAAPKCSKPQNAQYGSLNLNKQPSPFRTTAKAHRRHRQIFKTEAKKRSAAPPEKLQHGTSSDCKCRKSQGLVHLVKITLPRRHRHNKSQRLTALSVSLFSRSSPSFYWEECVCRREANAGCYSRRRSARARASPSNLNRLASVVNFCTVTIPAWVSPG